MKRLAAILAALFLLAAPVMAAQGAPDQPLSDPVLEARARHLQQQFRCVVCKVQSLDESNAPLAADLRKLIRDRVAAGESDQQISEFLVGRYGDFVLMQPPVRADTYFLWFGPILLLLAGAGVIAVTVARAKRRPALPELESENG